MRNIVYGYKQGNPDYIPNGIEKLSIGLYYLAFKRANKKVVRLEDAFNTFSFIENPKIIHYVSVYSAIKESIQSFCKDPRVLRNNSSIAEYEETILTLLKYTAEQLKKI